MSDLLKHLQEYFAPCGIPVGFTPQEARRVIGLDANGLVLNNIWLKSKPTEPDGGLNEPSVFYAPLVNRTSNILPRYVDNLTYTFGHSIADSKKHAEFISQWESGALEHADCCAVNELYILPLLRYLDTPSKVGSWLTQEVVEAGKDSNILFVVNGSDPFSQSGGISDTIFDCFRTRLVKAVKCQDYTCGVCGVSSSDTGHEWVNVGSPKISTASLLVGIGMKDVPEICGDCMTEIHFAFSMITRKYKIKGIKNKGSLQTHDYLYTNSSTKLASTDGFVDSSVRRQVMNVLGYADGVKVDENEIKCISLIKLSIMEMSSGTLGVKSFETILASEALRHATNFDAIKKSGGRYFPYFTEMSDLLEFGPNAVDSCWNYAVFSSQLPRNNFKKIVEKIVQVADSGNDPELGKRTISDIQPRQKIRMAAIQSALATYQNPAPKFTKENQGENMSISRGTIFGNLSRIAKDMSANYHRDLSNPKKNIPSLLEGNLKGIINSPGLLVKTLLPKASVLNESMKRSENDSKRNRAYWLDKRNRQAWQLWQESELGGQASASPLTDVEAAEFLIAFYGFEDKDSVIAEDISNTDIKEEIHNV